LSTVTTTSHPSSSNNIIQAPTTIPSPTQTITSPCPSNTNNVSCHTIIPPSTIPPHLPNNPALQNNIQHHIPTIPTVSCSTKTTIIPPIHNTIANQQQQPTTIPRNAHDIESTVRHGPTIDNTSPNINNTVSLQDTTTIQENPLLPSSSPPSIPRQALLPDSPTNNTTVSSPLPTHLAPPTTL